MDDNDAAREHLERVIADLAEAMADEPHRDNHSEGDASSPNRGRFSSGASGDEGASASRTPALSYDFENQHEFRNAMYEAMFSNDAANVEARTTSPSGSEDCESKPDCLDFEIVEEETRDTLELSEQRSMKQASDLLEPIESAGIFDDQRCGTEQNPCADGAKGEEEEQASTNSNETRSSETDFFSSLGEHATPGDEFPADLRELEKVGDNVPVDPNESTSELEAPGGSNISSAEGEARAISNVSMSTNLKDIVNSDETIPAEKKPHSSLTAKASLQSPSVRSAQRSSISKRPKDSSFKFILEIPFYRNEDDQRSAGLGFIDLSEPFSSYGSSHKLALEEMVVHYTTCFSETNIRSILEPSYLHNIPRSKCAKPQPQVKSPIKKHCQECKQSERIDVPKLPNKVSSVQSSAFNNEHAFLFLFLISERCYPFCLEYDNVSCDNMNISVDGINYPFSSGSVAPQSSAGGLSITTYYHNQVFSSFVPDFHTQKNVVLTLGDKGYNVMLTDAKFSLEDSDPRTVNYIRGETFFRVFGNPSCYFKVGKGNELRVNKTGSIFLNDRWTYGDTVRAKGCTGTPAQGGCQEEDLDLKIGQSGTLVVRSNGMHQIPKLFKPMITKDGKVFIIEKVLKVSFNYSKFD